MPVSQRKNGAPVFPIGTLTLYPKSQVSVRCAPMAPTSPQLADGAVIAEGHVDETSRPPQAGQENCQALPWGARATTRQRVLM
jgi:hypothetical protein